MNCKCRGVCRCLHRYELCAIVGIENTVKIPCPLDENNCLLDELDSSQLVITCPCCDHEILNETGIVTISNCKPCTAVIDLTGVNCNNTSCNLRYKIYINGSPYLAGILRLDWSFT